MRKKHSGVFLLSALALIVAFAACPRAAHAQCGSSASSCRNCHEVQKKDPVNTKGVWHTAHAFGDFCSFCHSGNTKAKDKSAAHAGMVEPLADVKGACQSCHPTDYMDRAKKYASVLGKSIGTGGAPGAKPTSSAPTAAALGPVAPTGGQVIDLNRVYAGLDQPRANVIGNAILVGMILVVALVLAGLVIHYERPLPRTIAAFHRMLAASVHPPGESALRPELAALMPLLSSSDPGTMRALAQLLADRESGPRVLKALSHVDLRALAALGESDQKALASLLTLVREMKG